MNLFSLSKNIDSRNSNLDESNENLVFYAIYKQNTDRFGNKKYKLSIKIGKEIANNLGWKLGDKLNVNIDNNKFEIYKSYFGFKLCPDTQTSFRIQPSIDDSLNLPVCTTYTKCIFDIVGSKLIFAAPNPIVNNGKQGKKNEIKKDLRLLSLLEVSEIVGFSVPTVKNYCQTGYLPAIKIGSRWRIPEDELYNWIKRALRGQYRNANEK